MPEREDLERLLRERERLDDELGRFRKTMAVMFIDVKGSTDFFDKWGDIEGRSMVQRFQDLMLPLIEKYNGKKEGTERVGDEIMAYFENTEDAIHSAVAIQRFIREHNRHREKRQQLHLRIGINSGPTIVEGGGVSGVVVNVAKRIESLAPVGGICITRGAYDEIRESDKVICRYEGEHELKGKAEPVGVYQVLWTEEERTTGKRRSLAETPSPSVTEEQIFYLEFHSEGDKISVASHEGLRGEHKTLKNYEDSKISFRRTEDYSKRIKRLLGRASRNGRVGNDILDSLKQTGQLLYDELLPQRAKKRLNSTHQQTLVLSIDDRLVRIPWELLYDGKEFLCQRFNMGRVVSTRQEFTARQRDVSLPLKVLLLADPQGNLRSSYEEGVRLRNMLDKEPESVNVSLKTSSISKDCVRGKLRFFDVLHYAGHADYSPQNPAESGFLLKDGKLTAKEIRSLVGRIPFPAFVFSNACHSGRTGEWAITEGYRNVYGIANAFLVSGVRHYLGTFWEIQDEPSVQFSLDFYQGLIHGRTIGEAVRMARLGLIDNYGEETVIWASYMLYGDPTFRYVERSRPVEEKAPREARKVAAHAGSLRAAEDVVVLPSKSRTWHWIAASAILLAVGLAVLLTNRHTGFLISPDEAKLLTLAPAPATSERHQQAIDSLVEELARKYREGNLPAVKPSDAWTSRPVSMVLLDIRGTGVSASGKDLILGKITEQLQAAKRVTMVERGVLDKLLRELKLSSSDLADPETALKIGRILSARLMATGSIMRERNDWMITFRLIETETTSIKAAINTVMETKDVSLVAEDLGRKLLRKVKEAYPLQGRIVTTTQQGVRINIGLEAGLTEGMKMEVLGAEGGVLGEIQVASAKDVEAEAVFLANEFEIAEGSRVREIRTAEASVDRNSP